MQLSASFLNVKARSDSEAYGIDLDRAVFEKVPLVVAPVRNVNLKGLFIRLNKKVKLGVSLLKN
jgi:hypothetical protein